MTGKVSAKDGAPAIPPAEMDVAKELNDIYHAAVVANKGDTKAGELAKQRAAPQVQRFAQLLNVARNGGSGAADALKQARSILGDGASSLDSWIHHHVDEDTIRAAGLDPVEMAKAAGIEPEPADPEDAGRDYRAFNGQERDLPNGEPAEDGMNLGEFSAPRRV